jgi:predicted acylesterase/phospholipase RssA
MEKNIAIIPFNEIALALSGGGFRAASYSLGCLSYLHRVIYKEQPLLKRVKFISSASGGSITNLFYSLKVASNPNEPFLNIFKELYDFLDDSETITDAFSVLRNDRVWKSRPDKGRNLINAFALSYDQRFFKGALFKELRQQPVHEVCINATEFEQGISFRFQNGSGKFGNSKITISQNAADSFKLADILAASSCFPMGFEPIMMPFDFAHEDLPANAIQKATTKEIEFGLMDGGITDNQGIYSFLLAEERKFGKDNHGYDLFMYCDVASPFMDGYELPKEKRSFLKNRSFQFYINLFKLTPLAFAGCLAALKWWHQPWWLIVLATLTGLSSLTYLIFLFFFIRERIKANKRKSTWMVILFKYINGILFTRTSAIIQMISARVKSAGILVGDVYLKQIRRLTINSLYENGESGEKWRLHAIANLVYEFSSINPKRSNDCKSIKDSKGNNIDLNPSTALIKCADLAREMDTTLWFDKFHVQDGRREALIAAGQFTTCFSLIDYICKLEKNSLVTPELKALQQKLLTDWAAFNNDPQFLATPNAYASPDNKW